ncbi:uncharacterized protein ACLA_013320 [Aspergillus clavatus NRRL 1]|uniref:Uncharacterized protein n=1 Tax=Aspergillus clavatus (strain ATCC 1007 / CBS 513.65 / DSM 816 / NCTC 3887 / NRRL 1 / QM 1276 / 107) TaxID=344612 RepID=A1CAX9_ASPCL|nr:uncharacterized protein ACLA_013320 [Aspergillus clavatus NRRL 1]EAW12897.1 conserved hypothetical protein [Aspergillus clavatus NRRL 1]
MSTLSLFVLSLTLTTAYFAFYHRALAARTHPVLHTGILASSLSASLTSIPAPVFTGKYFSIHCHASRAVSRQLLPSHNIPLLFTILLRRNLTVFSHFPKAWKLRSTCAPDVRFTFRTSYLWSLNFTEGDLICGIYRVAVRSPDRVEFAVGGAGGCEGRWVLRYWEEGEDVVFATESVTWRPVEQADPMPLESRMVRFFHETMSWWLLDSGVRYLMDLEGEFGPEEEEMEDKELVR